MRTTEGVTIWIYADKGVSELSLRSAMITFRQKLAFPHISSVQRISAADILANRLNGKGCLVMPGGADLPYTEQLNGLGNKLIKQFVAQGNLYIGICAGGYYGARDIAFHGDGYQIHGARELAFFKGTAIGSLKRLTQGRLYDDTTASKAIVALDVTNAQQDQFYYHGGAYFQRDEDALVKTIARYPDGTNAVVSGDVAHGNYLLSGVHFELSADIYQHYMSQTAHHLDKEQQLLDLLDSPQYGQAIFNEIDAMMESLFTPA